jgi:hypothetical protein
MNVERLIERHTEQKVLTVATESHKATGHGSSALARFIGKKSK